MWTLIGLILNFLGTILVAFSIVAGHIKVGGGPGDSIEHQIPIFKQGKFISGLVLIALGFLFQIIAVILAKFIYS